MKRILITGSNGLLGQKLVKLLSQKDDIELIATARGNNRLQNQEGYIYHTLDISQKTEVTSIIQQYKPQVIINTAAMTQVDDCETEQEQCWQLNVKAVEYLAEEASKMNAFLIHLSTDFIFDGKEGPYKEEAKASPISYYGESKLASEQLLSNYTGLHWAIVRTVLVYGIAENMSRSNLILWVKKSLEEEKTIYVVDDQWRTPTLAEDLAMGCYLIATKEAKGVFNISGKDLLTPYDMAIKTANYFDLDKKLIVRTDASRFQQTAQRPPKTGFILDKAYEILDYKPHSFEEGIDILYKQLQKVS